MTRPPLPADPYFPAPREVIGCPFWVSIASQKSLQSLHAQPSYATTIRNVFLGKDLRRAVWHDSSATTIVSAPWQHFGIAEHRF